MTILGYYPGILSGMQLSATHLKIRHEWFLYGCQSSNEMKWLDLKIGHQASNLSNDHQDNMTYLNILMT